MRNQYHRLWGILMLMGLAPLAVAGGTPSNVIGMVRSASNATVDNDPLLPNQVIYSGEAVAVRPGGSATLDFLNGARAGLTASTQARFSNVGGGVVAQLTSGTVLVTRETRQAVVVKIPGYSFAPQGEGKAEFFVAAVSPDRTIVEVGRGDVSMTSVDSGRTYILPQGHRAEIGASAVPLPGQSKDAPSLAVGQTNVSADATRNGKPLATDDWVMNGDTISTGASGVASVHLWPVNQATLSENSTASFTRPAERIWANLQKGKIVTDNTGAESVLIVTEKYHVESASAASSKISVELLPDGSTTIESRTGDVSITDIANDQSYLLPSGQKVTIPANSSSVPGLVPQGGGSATPGPPPESTPGPSPAPAGVTGHSHNLYLIIGLAAGGGAAAGIAAALAGGGGNAGSVAPPTSGVNP